MAASYGEQVTLGVDVTVPYNLPDITGLDERMQGSGSFQQKDLKSDHTSKVNFHLPVEQRE